MADGRLTIGVVSGDVHLIAGGQVVGRAGSRGLELLLDQGNAERSAAALEGYLQEDPAQLGVRVLSLTLQSLALPGGVDRAVILVLRAVWRVTEAIGSQTLTLDDVVEALREAREFHNGPEDMNEYWDRRVAATLALFGLSRSDDPGHWDTWSTIDHVIAALNGSSNPFTGILEAPPEVGEILSRYVAAYEELEEKRQELGTKTLKDLLCLIDPKLIIRGIPADELQSFGLAARPPREDLMMDGDW